jgi:hypothetical protein
MDFSEKHKYLRLDSNNQWFVFSYMFSTDTEITLDQLEQMLLPKQEIKMELDALKLIAESYGFELVEKKREIKVGDFGKFWDIESCIVYGFLESISDVEPKFIYKRKTGALYINFAHLTDEEKANIQQNW